MMQTGATLRNFTLKKRALYALIYALIGAAAVVVGYCLAAIFKNVMNGSAEMTAASLIIFFLGLFVIFKSFRSDNGYVEKLDPDFNCRKMLRLSVLTNIDTMVLMAGFSFMGLMLRYAMISVLVVSFLTVFIALSIGYNLGTSYQKLVGISGGALMVFFSIWILANYVIMR
ncbi:MAG: manganese efflux pump [Lactimicrobium sp.]|uniref:manganese efflux pump n=1 Tax=Lactimicrobium sp. TaxID=2563780 RepID=UPI002F35A431